MSAILSSIDWTWIYTFIFGLIGIYLFPWSHLRSRWLLSRIPGPGIPFFGIAFDLWNLKSEDIIPKFETYWKEYRKYGAFQYVFPPGLFVNLTKPEYLQIILSDSEQTQKSIDYDSLQPWLGNGLLLSSGKKWHSRRKLLTPSFHFRNLELFADVINEQSKILLQQLETEIGKEFAIFPYISRCTLDVICQTAMGRTIDAQKNQSSEYLEAIQEMSRISLIRSLQLGMNIDWIFNMTSMAKEQEKCLRILHGFTNKVIQEKKLERSKNREVHSNVQEDPLTGTKKRLPFLDLLLETSDNGRVLTDEDIREEVDTFMFAGHDTTAAGTSWTLYLLGHHPEIQEKILEELDKVIGPEDEVTTKHLTQLKYLEQVIKESLRIYSPAPMIGRRLTKDMKFGEHLVPSGAVVNVMPYFVHRDPDIFPDPEKFDPDRFLPEEIQKRHPYSFIPFSAGPRNCIGQRFALMEEKILLSHILRAYKITSVIPRDKLKLTADIILHGHPAILLKVQPRQ